MGKYLLHGKLTASKGNGGKLADILTTASSLVSTAKGYHFYIVSKSQDEEDTVYVTELWDSKEDHDNSLHVKGVKELISQAMPILKGIPEKGQELEVLGGF